MAQVQVGIIMGSQSDWPTMREAAAILDELGVAYETRIVSAHRTPDRLWEYGRAAVSRGLQVIIAGAGGAAHLPGMMASKNPCASDRCAGADTGAGRGSIACIPSCRCRVATRWRPWPLAARPMPG